MTAEKQAKAAKRHVGGKTPVVRVPKGHQSNKTGADVNVMLEK